MRMRGTHHQFDNHGTLSRWIFVLSVLLFFSVQILASAHNAAHNNLDHKHGGVRCIVGGANKHCDDMDLVHLLPSLQPTSAHERPLEVATHSILAARADHRLIRGPPLFS